MKDLRAQIEEGLRYQKLGMLDRALREYERTVEATRDPTLRCEALCRQAHVFRAWCQWERAIDAARRAAELAHASGLDQQKAEAINAEAIVHLELGRFDEAVVLFERILALQIDDRMRGIAFGNLGSIAAQRADLGRAEQYYRSAIRSFGRAGYEWGQAFSLTNFSAVMLESGRLKEAEVMGSQAMRAAKKVGDLELVGIAALNIAEALAPRGGLEKAEALISEALGYFVLEENELRRAQCLRVLGDVKLLRGDHEEAGLLYDQAMALATHVGADREVSRLDDCRELLAAVIEARDRASS
jgi:tetratricopeptide (TPR) repeat protein